MPTQPSNRRLDHPAAAVAQVTGGSCRWELQAVTGGTYKWQHSVAVAGDRQEKKNAIVQTAVLLFVVRPFFVYT